MILPCDQLGRLGVLQGILVGRKREAFRKNQTVVRVSVSLTRGNDGA